jgi:hypothetical protein
MRHFSLRVAVALTFLVVAARPANAASRSFDF